MAEFSIVPPFDQVVLVAWSDKMAPPSAKIPRSVPHLLPMVAIAFWGQLTVSASSESTFVSSVESSSLVLLGVEHLTV